MALPVIAAAAKGAVVASKAVKGAKIASAVSKGVKAGKILPKLNVTNMKSVFTDENTDTYVKSLKEAVKSGGKLRTAKRRKSKQSVEEIKADIDAREAKKAKIKPSKLLPPPEMGLKLEEKVKLNSEKITKIISIQKLHKTNHKKEKDEISEISSVLTNIADFIKKDYDDRIKGEEDKTNKLKELESKRAQKEEEKGLESSKKTGEKIGKRSLGIVQPVQSIFDKLLNAVAAIGIGIGGTAIFDYLSNPEIFQKLNGFFDFIKKHWKWVLGGIGVIAAIAIVGPIVAIGSAIAGVVAAIAGVAVVVGKIALAVAAVVGVIMGASSIFRWLRGGKEAQEARLKNREAMKEEGVEKAHITGVFGERYKVMRDGKKTKLKYSELTDEEKAVVDKFKGEDKRIKEVTKERNFNQIERKKQIEQDRKASDEYAEIQAMSSRGGAGIKKREALDAFKQETSRLQNESDKQVVEEFKLKYEGRKIGGDASGMKLVGEGGPEIVDFKTASSVKTAQRTQELLKDISQDGGVNIITMDLPPIKAAPPQVSADSGTPSTEVEMIASVNPFNSYMSITPDILKID
tara:strand:- start:486 stop:2207 length:1722 start_codon:yes stop_codon:yes gene_type:complete